MKIRWTLPLFVLFSVCSALATTRHYYIAAEDVPWNYAPSGIDLLSATPIRQPWSLKLQWPKTRFIEYTDDTFTSASRNPTGWEFWARSFARKWATRSLSIF